MAAEVVEKEFGRYLQTCRRSKGVSLEVVSHQTKITPNILRQIENEDFAHLPAPVFIRGFIKAFAGAVGADPDEAVNRFERYLNCRDQACPVSTVPPKSSSRQYGLALSTALFIALVGATLYLAQWIHSSSSPSSLPPKLAIEADEADASESLQIAASETQPENTPEVPPVITPEAVPPTTAGTASVLPVVTLEKETSVQIEAPVSETEVLSQRSDDVAPNFELRMTAIEATWLKVVLDDQAPQEFLLKTDEDVTLVAKNGFDLVIGNASGIRLMLNEKPVPVVGKRGQVVDIHLP